jgi:hypothetical protein
MRKIELKEIGCGKKINYGICGEADAWGHEPLCQECKKKLRWIWDEEDYNNTKLQKIEKYINKETIV